MPRHTAVPKAHPAGTLPTLAEQQADFTAEGSPLPGLVANAPPVLAPGPVPTTMPPRLSPAAPPSPPAAPKRRTRPR